MEKLDYKKVYSDLYLPKKAVSEVTVLAIPFIGVDGRGLPGSGEFQSTVALLYSYAFTIKMSKLSGDAPAGYFEYVVPPLEGLYGTEAQPFSYFDQSTWAWTLMIRQPDFVTPQVFAGTREALRKKKPELAVDQARFFTFEEGRCIQIMHIGSYESLYASGAKLEAYAREQGLRIAGRHHEINLSDPRRTRPEKLKTVLRAQVTAQ